jgi:hypothetical protein
MTVKTSLAFALVACAVVLTAGAGAQAQSYSAAYTQPPPLYPYVVARPYAAAAPDAYSIYRPAIRRPHRHVHAFGHSRGAGHPATAPSVKVSERPHRVVDRALIEELRQRMQPKLAQDNPDNAAKAERTAIDTTKIVHDAPVVVETKRVVDDPPRVTVRRHLVETAPSRCRHGSAARCGLDLRARAEDDRGHVIHADAEITILGPDRISIRLFRKRRGAEARAQAGD